MATDILDVLRTKRDGGRLSDEQIRFFIDGYTDGSIADTASRTPAGAPGSVVLVGGGPGDPGLVTVRGRQAVATADVVLADHLAPQGLLASLPAHVEVIDASKLPRGRSMAQEQINELLGAVAALKAYVAHLPGAADVDLEAVRRAGRDAGLQTASRKLTTTTVATTRPRAQC